MGLNCRIGKLFAAFFADKKRFFHAPASLQGAGTQWIGYVVVSLLGSVYSCNPSIKSACSPIKYSVSSY
jgi:hypothetical protein